MSVLNKLNSLANCLAGTKMEKVGQKMFIVTLFVRYKFIRALHDDHNFI